MPDIRAGAVRPILKWAGGKRQLLPELRPFYPRRFDRYFEPFLGSGAVFLDLLQQRPAGRPRRAAVGHQRRRHRLLPRRARRGRARSSARSRRSRPATGREARRTSTTCATRRSIRRGGAIHDVGDPAGGLHAGAGGDAHLPEPHRLQRPVPRERARRVQRAGRALRQPEDLRRGQPAAPGARRSAAPACRSRSAPFDAALADAGQDDFVYLDPPYAPLSGTARFTSYTAGGFDAVQQEALQRTVIALAARGASVLLSNSVAPADPRCSTPAGARPGMAGLRATTVAARRAINSRAASRGPVREYLITNVPRCKLLA